MVRMQRGAQGQTSGTHHPQSDDRRGMENDSIRTYFHADRPEPMPMTIYNEHPNPSETTMNTLNNTDNTVKQFTTVYHTEYGKGKVVSLTPKMKDQLVMVFFPKPNTHDWCLLSALETGTDEYMSLTPAPQNAPKDNLSDPLQQALDNLFGGRR